MTTENLFVQVHLNFDGRCEEAIEFYKKAIGAKVVMMARFKDMPPQAASDGPGCAPTSPEKIMHARIQIGETVVLVSDGRCQGKEMFQGVALSITVQSDDEVDRLCNALASEGGQIYMPPAKTFFSSRFGMANDKFGLCWMVLVKPVGT